MATHPIIKESERWLNALDRSGNAAVRRLVSGYDGARKHLLSEISDLERAMLQIDQPTRRQLFRLDRYKNLLRQVNNEIGALGGDMARESLGLNRGAATMGARAGINVGLIAGGEVEPVVLAFERIDPATVARAASFVNSSSSLYKQMRRQYGRSWSETFASNYITGVALGWNPRKIARNLRKLINTAIPASIETIIRTAQLWTYRSTQHDAWLRSGVVDYWTWHAHLEKRTCGSCWSLHGTKHPADELLNDHYNGRCVAIPHTIALPGYPSRDLDFPSGESVFASLSKARQEELARSGGWAAQWRAWNAGAISFEDMTTTRDDQVYGDMRGLASLKSILGESRAKEYYGG